MLVSAVLMLLCFAMLVLAWVATKLLDKTIDNQRRLDRLERRAESPTLPLRATG